MNCLACGNELLDVVAATVALDGPQICGPCIDAGIKLKVALLEALPTGDDGSTDPFYKAPEFIAEPQGRSLCCQSECIGQVGGFVSLGTGLRTGLGCCSAQFGQAPQLALGPVLHPLVQIQRSDAGLLGGITRLLE